MYDFTHSSPCHEMEKSGQPHALAALASGKKFLVPIGFKTVRASDPVGTSDC